MIKSITAAQKISISINICTNKYYPGAARLGFRNSRQSKTTSKHLQSPLSVILCNAGIGQVRSEKWADRRRVSSVLSWDRILINLAAGGGQSWMSRAAVWIFTKGKNNSQHLVLVRLFACLTPHTYGEALITMTAFPYTCQHRAQSTQPAWSHHSPLTTHMISRLLSLSAPPTTQ